MYLTSKNSFWFECWIILKWVGSDSPLPSSLGQSKHNYLIRNGEGGPIFCPCSALNLARSIQWWHMEFTGEFAAFQGLTEQDFLKNGNTSKFILLTQVSTALGRGQGMVQSYTSVHVLSMLMTHHLDWRGYALSAIFRFLQTWRWDKQHHPSWIKQGNTEHNRSYEEIVPHTNFYHLFP